MMFAMKPGTLRSYVVPEYIDTRTPASNGRYIRNLPATTQ